MLYMVQSKKPKEVLKLKWRALDKTGSNLKQNRWVSFKRRSKMTQISVVADAMEFFSLPLHAY